jgi:hypothetical protein
MAENPFSTRNFSQCSNSIPAVHFHAAAPEIQDKRTLVTSILRLFFLARWNEHCAASDGHDTNEDYPSLHPLCIKGTQFKNDESHLRISLYNKLIFFFAGSLILCIRSFVFGESFFCNFSYILTNLRLLLRSSFNIVSRSVVVCGDFCNNIAAHFFRCIVSLSGDPTLRVYLLEAKSKNYYTSNNFFTPPPLFILCLQHIIKQSLLYTLF